MHIPKTRQGIKIASLATQKAPVPDPEVVYQEFAEAFAGHNPMLKIKPHRRGEWFHMRLGPQVHVGVHSRFGPHIATRNHKYLHVSPKSLYLAEIKKELPLPEDYNKVVRLLEKSLQRHGIKLEKRANAGLGIGGKAFLGAAAGALSNRIMDPQGSLLGPSLVGGVTGAIAGPFWGWAASTAYGAGRKYLKPIFAAGRQERNNPYAFRGWQVGR